MQEDNNTPSDNTGKAPGERKRVFAQAYHRIGNATRAAIEAGYSVKGAQQAGSRLLRDKHVIAELARLAAGGKSPEQPPKPIKEAAPKARAKAPKRRVEKPAEAPHAVSNMLLSRKPAPDPEQPIPSLTQTEEAFLTEYLRNGGNATAAWVFVHPGMPPGRANAAAWKALRRPRMLQRLHEERLRMAAKHEMTRDQLLAEFLAIVRADPNELVQMRHVACSDCWPGAEKGGRWTEPDPECEECAGEGEAIPWIADTRNLSPTARALFAGVKVTANGVQILLHDKLAALAHIGRILGAFEADNRQQQPALTEAVAGFLAQLHGAGRARLPIVERTK